MKWSILICTLPERGDFLNRIMGILLPQTIGKEADVEILYDAGPSGISTGQKRNDLIARSKGDYFCFVDDDDLVSGDYIAWILYGIATNPDVVTFKGKMLTNGASPVEWSIKLGEKYEARQDTDGITRYYRFPNHLTAMKRSKVAHIKFPHEWQGEDYKWAKEINDRGLLKSEIHIPKELYTYLFRTRK